MSDLWYEDYVPAERSSDLQRRYIMPSIGSTASDDAAVDVEGISDWTSLQDAWGVTSFESRAKGATHAVSEIEAYSSGGFGSEYTPVQYSAPSHSGRSGGTSSSYGGGSASYSSSAPSYATGAPSYATGATGAPSAPYGAAGYSLEGMYDENRVSCSSCNWELEDKSWCCDRDCNDPNGGHYRQAYVCADPSDPTGKLTSRCEVETECLADQPPTMCSTERLLERQRGDTRDDPSCASWRARTNRPRLTDAPAYATGSQGYATRAPYAPSRPPASTFGAGAATSAQGVSSSWPTTQGTTHTTGAPTYWSTPATSSYSPTAPWLGRS